MKLEFHLNNAAVKKKTGVVFSYIYIHVDTFCLGSTKTDNDFSGECTRLTEAISIIEVAAQ